MIWSTRRYNSVKLAVIYRVMAVVVTVTRQHDQIGWFVALDSTFDDKNRWKISVF